MRGCSARIFSTISSDFCPITNSRIQVCHEYDYYPNWWNIESNLTSPNRSKKNANAFTVPSANVSRLVRENADHSHW